MYEIFVLFGIVMLLLAAHRGTSRKRRRGVIMLKISETAALGTLGSGSAFKDNFDSTVVDSVFLLSIEAAWSYGEHTPDQGPIPFGVAHSDYSAAEIGEWFAATGAWDKGDKVAQEHARRKIRQVGVFDGALAQGALNNGQPIKTKLKFGLAPGDTLAWWAVNQDTSVLTTGTLLQAEGMVWAVKA